MKGTPKMPATRKPAVTPTQLLELDILLQETEGRLVRLERSEARTRARYAALVALRETLTT